MDVSTVKSEIKAWERKFKAEHAREPTVDDIKQHPDVADRYRLYKKLSKATKPSAPSLLPPQSRPAETTAPLNTFNPFSPRKKKPGRQPSPDLPSTNPFPLLLSKPSTTPPAPSTAISRARKRLRGEPVSPSPNKGKRPRLGSLPLPDPSDSSSSEDDQERLAAPSFFSNSPVKAPRGSKSFALLFQDGSKPTNIESSSSAPSLARIKSTSVRGLFGGRPNATSVNLDDDLGSEMISTNNKGSLKSISSRPLPPLLQINPTKPEATEQSETNTAAKRPFSLSDYEDINSSRPISAAGVPLLPPSPPPPDSSARSKFPNSAKTKSTGRNKVKNAGNNSSDQSDDEHLEGVVKTSVKIVTRTHLRLGTDRPSNTRLQQDEGHLDPDLDPILRVAPRGGPSPPPPGAQLEGRFEVDLPDELRHVLALEPAEANARYFREERLVQGLVTGSRVTHYDPNKGGEIWDVGEDDVDTRHHGQRVIDEEDDWEGEPVPWEVAEL